MTDRITLFVFLTALFLFSRPLWAQSSSSGDGRYVIEQRYVQTIEWIGDKYTIKYEIVIEKNEDGNYKTYIREFTEKPSVQVSLPLGKYRYRIIPYDYLEHPGDASDWMDIEIKPAPIARVEVQKADDGSYDLHPYEDEQTVPSVMDIYAGLAYTPIFHLHGENNLFGENLSLYGLSVRVAAVSAKPDYLNLGIEGVFTHRVFADIQGGNSAPAFAFGLNALAQYRFNGRAALNSRFGAGVSMRLPESADNEKYSVFVNFGLSFLWLPIKHFYLDVGIEYAQYFMRGYFGGLSPMLMAGYRF